MDVKKIGFGLGLFSVALGALEIAAAHRISQAIDGGDHKNVVRSFGLHDVLAGINLITAPAAAPNVWNRVASDAMEVAALGATASKSRGNRAAWGALAFVVGVTILDVVTALGLERETGKALAARDALPA